MSKRVEAQLILRIKSSRSDDPLLLRRYLLLTVSRHAGDGETSLLANVKRRSRARFSQEINFPLCVCAEREYSSPSLYYGPGVGPSKITREKFETAMQDFKKIPSEYSEKEIHIEIQTV